MSRRIAHCVCALLIAAAQLVSSAAVAQTQAVDRTVVEAAYVMNFLNYSEWPGQQAVADEVTLLVVAPPSVVRTFRAAADAASSRNGRRVRVRGIDPARMPEPRRLVAQLSDMHAVFVAGQDPEIAGVVIDAARHQPLLTIGDGREFVERGGMLAFLHQGDNVLFTSNLRAVLDSPVVLSSRVLRLAREPTGLPEDGATMPAMGRTMVLQVRGAVQGPARGATRQRVVDQGVLAGAFTTRPCLTTRSTSCSRLI